MPVIYQMLRYKLSRRCWNLSSANFKSSSAPVSLLLLIDFPVNFQAFELAEKHPEFKVGYFDLKIVSREFMCQ